MHPFIDSGFKTWQAGKAICGRCGSIEGARVHTMPAVPDEVRAVEARRLGEAE